MTAAIFGLLGVIIGGGLTYLTEAQMESRRERAAAKASARLVVSELIEALSAAEDTLEKSRWPAGNWFSTDVWGAHKEVLARVLTTDQWVEVSEAYISMEWLSANHRPGEPLEVGWAAVRDSYIELEKGSDALMAHAKREDPTLARMTKRVAQAQIDRGERSLGPRRS